jgi:hypothetical protein
MGYVYKGYCYESLDAAAVAVHGDGALLPGPSSLTAVYVNGSVLDLSVTDVSSGTPVVRSLSWSPSQCSTVGPLTNQTGLNIQDAVDLGWAVSTSLLAAFALVVIRRAV